MSDVRIYESLLSTNQKMSEWPSGLRRQTQVQYLPALLVALNSGPL